MHVAFVAITPFPRTGGGWTFLSEVSSEMKARNHTTSIVSPQNIPPVLMALVDRAAQIVRVVFGSWMWFFVRMALVEFALRTYVGKTRLCESADVLDAQDPAAFLAVYPLALRWNRPT